SRGQCELTGDVYRIHLSGRHADISSAVGESTMSDQAKYGGPAFPLSVSMSDDGAVVCSDYFNEASGMTLRDYFAAKAMQGRCAAGLNVDADSCVLEAEIAYQLADAMLKARYK